MLALCWQAFSMLLGEETMLFPGPVKTFEHAFQLLESPYTWKCISSTMMRMLDGFFLSFGLALLLGVPAGNFEAFEVFLAPFITMLRAIPTASLVYLFIVLAGFRKAPVYLVTLICFPIIYEGVRTGIANTPETILQAARLDKASFFKENLAIRLPLAMPFVIASAASAFSLSFKIEIMAEVITGSSIPGLGSAIAGVRAADPTNMVPVFSYSLIAVGLMLVIDFFSTRIREHITSK